MITAMKNGWRAFRQTLTSGTGDPAPWLVEALGGGSTSLTGATVNVPNALGLPAVWNSINIVAGHMGQIPLEHRKRMDRGSELMTDTNVHQLLNVRANSLMTASVFKSTMMAHALLVGNGRAVILRDELGRANEIILMWPENTFVVMEAGIKYHVVWFDQRYLSQQLPYSMAHQEFTGAQSALYKIPDRDVLHIHNLSWNGLWGESPLALAKDVFGLDMTGIQTAATMFRNNGKPSLILEAPRGILTTEKKAREFLQAFRSAHEGIDNTAKTGLLREGVTARPLPINASDAQYLDSRKFSRDDLALLFGTEYLMGESSAVYKDLQERQSAYVTNTLGRWIECWEQQSNEKMIDPLPRERDLEFVQGNPVRLMQGSPNSMATYTSSLRQQGAVTGNEVREFHHLNPEDDPELESYGNPNITAPEEPQDDSEPTDDTEDENPNENDQEASQAAKRYIFQKLIDRERDYILNRAGKPNFSHKLEGFYDRQRGLMLEAAEVTGVPREKALAHCESSVSQILEVISITDPTGVADELDRLTRNWSDRAEEF